MQSAGFSRFKIGLAVMKTALPLVLFTMIIGEWGIPQTEQFARDMRTHCTFWWFNAFGKKWCMGKRW